jgi:hypothetical protein
MDEVYAYFAVIGEGPHSEIGARLRLEPSRAWSAGDPRPGGGVYPATKWFLESGLDRTRPLEEHVSALLPILESKAEAIRAMSPQYEIILQCVGYFENPSPGFHLDAPTIQRIAALGLAIDFDLYSRSGDDDG